MSKTIRYFFYALADFAILEVAQTAIEVADLLLRVVHQVRDLFRSETDPPEHAPLAFSCESLIEYSQALGVFKGVQVFFYTRLDERHRLRKNLDDGSRPTALFRE